MKNYIESGLTFTAIAPADITTGELVEIGELVCVASTTVKKDETFVGLTSGVFLLPKATGAINAGDVVKVNSKKIEKANGKVVGYAIETVASAATEVLVLFRVCGIV